MANLTPQKLEAIRSEYKHRRIGGKYPRQKMLPEYSNLYPWVLADEKDPYFIFCTVCECRLSAKRSDLGKHEGSIKHKENTAKKIAGISIERSFTACPDSVYDPSGEEHENEYEDDDDDDDTMEETYMKHEPMIDLVEHSNSELNLEMTDGEGADDGEVDEDKYERDSSSSYMKSMKRRASETDSHSQHSAANDYKPQQLTVNEATAIASSFSYKTCISNSALASGGNCYSTVQQQMAATAALPSNAPCKITIKKITTPIAAATPPQVTSTATITQVHRLTQQQQQQQHVATTSTGVCIASQQQLPTPTHSVSTLAAPVRDSFDLFFESICATVKALPPKLATEGKIRVMQLIGELELRAIDQREYQGGRSNLSNDISQAAQQNAISTTK